MPRTLLLDLDGTLVDTVADLAAALNRLMRTRLLPPFSRAQVASMVGDGVATLVCRSFDAHGRLPDETAVADFVADYAAHVADESRPYPDVDTALRGLRDAGWTLAVCTNKPEDAARRLLDAVGLLPLLRAVSGGDTFAVRKPDPGPLLATLALTAGAPDRAVMLGDHRNDVIAARAAGMPCIFAGWGYGSACMAEGSVAFAHDILEAGAIANRLLPPDEGTCVGPGQSGISPPGTAKRLVPE